MNMGAAVTVTTCASCQQTAPGLIGYAKTCLQLATHHIRGCYSEASSTQNQGNRDCTLTNHRAHGRRQTTYRHVPIRITDLYWYVRGPLAEH